MTPFAMGIFKIQMRHKTYGGERRDIKPPTGFNPRPLSNVKFAMELSGDRRRKDGNRDRKKKKKRESGRGRHRELEIIASIDKVTLGGFQRD